MAHDSVKSFSAANPAYTPQAIRWTIFSRGNELEKAGAIFRLGRKVVIVREKFLQALESGVPPRQAKKTAKAKQAEAA